MYSTFEVDWNEHVTADSYLNLNCMMVSDWFDWSFFSSSLDILSVIGSEYHFIVSYLYSLQGYL